MVSDLFYSIDCFFFLLHSKSRMKFAGHNGQNERQEFTEKISEPCTETRRL